MFAVAPLAPRLRLREPPVATLLLVVAIAVAGARILCAVAPDAAPTADVTAVHAATPFETWGYRRGAEWVRAISALFVHADAAHLIANLLPLAAAGACLEQAWGAPPTLLLFLVAGAASIAIDARLDASGSLVVGASAGVSAILGACFVRFRRQRLPFGWVYFEYARPRCGRFEVSCGVVGIAWALQQTIGAVWSACAGDASVAFAAHLAAAAQGAIVALASESAARALRPA